MILASTAPTAPVILNLFQDPFLATRRRVLVRDNGAVALSTSAAGHEARWMLKQVQHDDLGKGGA